MPWAGVSLMQLRRSLIEDYRRGSWSVSELAAEYGISRKTFYKWLARADAGGWAALADRSRRPRTSPQAVSAEIRAAVCAVRRRRPLWGPRKIRAWLCRREPDRAWPSRVTMAAILRAAGLVERPPRIRAWPPPRGRTAATLPNDVWTIDFKGDFRVGDGTRCHPLTVRDLASRFTLACAALTDPNRHATRRTLTRVFQEYGLPRCIRSDNGPPFAGPGLGGLSQLNVDWLRLGIRVEQIAPGRPDQNGAHEHFHRVLKAATTRPPAPTVRRQQQRFNVFVRDYNTERPHEALGDAVPATRYVASPRPCPATLPDPEYPGHWDTSVVGSNGCIRWRGRTIFLTRALVRQRIALEEVDDDLWTVRFAHLRLARWDGRAHRLRPLPRD